MNTATLQDEVSVTGSTDEAAAVETPRERMSIEEYFAITPMMGTCIDAANRASRHFDSEFPGWELYARIVRGETSHDAKLQEWAIAGARMLSVSRQNNGHPYIRTSILGEWVDFAALDAFSQVVGLPIPSARSRGDEFGIKVDTYLKVFKPVNAMMHMGLMLYTSDLEFEFKCVKHDERELNASMGSGESRAIVGRDSRVLARGCSVKPSCGEADEVTGRSDETLNHGIQTYEAWRKDFEAPGPVVDIPVHEYTPANRRH